MGKPQTAMAQVGWAHQSLDGAVVAPQGAAARVGVGCSPSERRSVVQAGPVTWG